MSSTMMPTKGQNGLEFSKGCLPWSVVESAQALREVVRPFMIAILPICRGEEKTRATVSTRNSSQEKQQLIVAAVMALCDFHGVRA